MSSRWISPLFSVYAGVPLAWLRWPREPRDPEQRGGFMQETQARLLSLDGVRASVRRLQRLGKRLVGQLRHDARRLVERSGKPVVEQVLALVDVGKLRADVQGRAERAVKDLDARRVRLLTALEGQLERLTDPVVEELRTATRQVAELKRRIAQVERRLETLAKEKPSKNRAA